MSSLNRPFESTQHIIGAVVRDPGGDPVGEVNDVIFDTVEGRIAYVHLDLRRSGGRNRVVVPWSALSVDTGHDDGWRIAAHKATLDRFAGTGTETSGPRRSVTTTGQHRAVPGPASVTKEHAMETQSPGRKADLDREPDDVVADPALGLAEKIRILEDLRLDAVELQTATAENMPPSGDTAGQATERLSRIDAALRMLRGDDG